MNFTEALTRQLMDWQDETTWLSASRMAALTDLRAMLDVTYCGRCSKKLHRDQTEVCWYCSGDLCGACWEQHGHCGHPEADAINERMRAWLKRSECV